MAQLNREALLKKQELKMRKVEFENGDYVFVREMTGYDRDAFENSIRKEKYNEKNEFIGYDQVSENFRSKLAVMTICDEVGELLLRPDDYVLFSKSIRIVELEKIIEAALDLNKISKKDKEELTKNLNAAPVDNSNSGSVEN